MGRSAAGGFQCPGDGRSLMYGALRILVDSFLSIKGSDFLYSPLFQSQGWWQSTIFKGAEGW